MTDEAYEAGYRAGHLQGWMDAMARMADLQAAPGPTEQRPVAPPPHAATLPVPSWPPAAAPPRAVPQRSQPQPRDPAAIHAATPATTRPADRPVAARPPKPPVRPALSPAEQQARRERRDRQNINVTLYVASLLLVAAAALFIGTGLPPLLRFAGVTVVAGLFYGLGLGLHARVERLRPAAVAFAGTGLALVPVAGLALYNFAWHNGPGAWLATSLVGTAAYAAAALRLESRILVYLSLTFVVSSAWSGVSVLGAALVWYFVVMIAVAVSVTVLSMVRPGWLPPVYVRPLATLHPYLVPAVAMVATFCPVLLAKAEYALILGLCGVYFALLAAVSSGRSRLRYFYGARAALTVAAATTIWAMTGQGSDALLTVAGLLALQSCALAFGAGRLDVWFRSAVPSAQVGPEPGAPAPPAGPPPTHPSDGDARPARRWWRLDALSTFVAQLLFTAAYAMNELVGAMFSFDVQAGELPFRMVFLLALVTGAVIAAKLGGSAEAAPAAALVLAGIFSHQLGEGTLAGLLAAAGLFWLVRGRLAEGALRHLMVFGARAAATLAAPAVVAAVTDGPGQDRAVWFSLVLAALAQQLLSAALERYGRRTLAPQATLAGYMVLGVASLYSLSAADTGTGASLTLAATFIHLAAVLTAGLALLPRVGRDDAWRPTVGELLPPVVAVLLIAFAFEVLGLESGNFALLMLLAYLAACALRLPAVQHRWSYWWMSRGAGTLLVLTAFEQLAEGSGRPIIAGEVLDPAVVLATALGAQLVFPLRAFIHGQAPRGVRIDAGVVLLLQLASCAAAGPLTGSLLSAGNWQHPLIVGVAAVSAAWAGYVLRRGAGAVWYAPVTFLVLAVLSANDAPLLEIVLGVYAVFAGIMVVGSAGRAAKGWYFVAARALTACLAGVFSYDLTASPTAVSVTLSLVLAAQHAIRWVMRFRLAEVPFQQAAVWITLAGQALLPVAYAVQHAADPHSGGGRWVLYLEFALLLASVVAARRLFAALGALYLGHYAVLGAVLSLSPLPPFGDEPVLSYTGTSLMLILLGLAATAAGMLHQRIGTGAGAEHWLWLVSAGSFVAAALLLGQLAADWVPGVAVLALAAVCFTASHVEGWAVLYAPAAGAFLAGAFMAASVAFGDHQGAWGTYLPWLAGPGAAAAVMYCVRLISFAGRVAGGQGAANVRARALAGAALLGYAAAALAGLPWDATAWTAAAAFVLVVAVASREAPPRARRAVAEVGVAVLVAFIQRAAIFQLDGAGGGVARFGARLPDGFWVAQWYVVLGAVLSGLRYLGGYAAIGRSLAAASAGLLTVSGLGVLFGGSGGQQLWVLACLAILLAAGLALGDRIFVRWGAAGVAACILWAMRQYTFALLALIAVGLIAFAVWRLNRSTDNPGGEGGQGRAGTRP
ncbi:MULTISPECIES: hypothetical protein [unclassified Arthrobacter]|uniref:hypothetical protein n=1 Tax=unclassified Arthrobacter TaxID=235627 RepID=UPI001C860D77|nr:hypothetical protein [Arthrobacter sp. MAHUQ-56]MBX7445155.1 hypothetical protein [Arthrobacter sp. MAHUQ-56]